MGWICNKCGKDNGGVKGQVQFCYEQKKCKDAGKFACTWTEPQAATWMQQEGQLFTPTDMAAARADLTELIRNASGEIYSKKIGTVVGGTSIKGKAKKIDGLNDPSARIDVQNPVGSKGYNLQYQIGDYSYACVLFTNDDSRGVVLAKLHESLTANRVLRSPNL